MTREIPGEPIGQEDVAIKLYELLCPSEQWAHLVAHKREVWRRRANVLIRTLDAARKAKEWVPVPETLTRPMWVAAADKHNTGDVWNALLAAAPQPTCPSDLSDEALAKLESPQERRAMDPSDD